MLSFCVFIHLVNRLVRLKISLSTGSITGGIVLSYIYDKQDEFNFIFNFPFLRAPSYGVFYLAANSFSLEYVHFLTTMLL